jgi:hypothetical protein
VTCARVAILHLRLRCVLPMRRHTNNYSYVSWIFNLNQYKLLIITTIIERNSCDQIFLLSFRGGQFKLLFQQQSPLTPLLVYFWDFGNDLRQCLPSYCFNFYFASRFSTLPRHFPFGRLWRRRRHHGIAIRIDGTRNLAASKLLQLFVDGQQHRLQDHAHGATVF